MKNFGKLALLGAALAVSATSAHATPTLGAIVYSTGVETVTGQTTFTATATETVYKDLSSPFAGCASNNCLVFELQVTDVTGQKIESITLGSFSAFLSGAGFTAVGGDVAPSTVAANVNGGYTFSFASGLGNGSTTDILWVETNATSFGPGTLGVIDNSAGSASAVVGATPEPSSLMLLGTGLVGAAGMLFRRRQTV